MASKTAPPAAPPAEEPAPDDGAPGASAPAGPREPRFFAWVRSLGLVRRSGWLGGVCAAVADRTRLDPILVRGIVVVLAVLGAPVVLVYAAAWLLLPDERGDIHALTLARGRVESAVVAIAGLVLLSFLPLAQGFWWAGASYWGRPDFFASAGRVVWTGVVIIVAIVVVVWLARRAAHPDVRTVPATTDDRPETVPTAPAESRVASDATTAVVEPGAGPAAPAAAQPAAPAAGASDAELAAWRARQEEWKQQRAAWAAQQRAEDRARRAGAQALAAEQREARLAERRRREPFVGGAVIGIVLGLAVVAGAGVGLAVGIAHPDRATGWSAGLGAAVVVFGLALAVAGIARRRAGGLAALAILALLGAVATVPLAADRALIPVPGYYGIDTSHGGRYARIVGSTELLAVKGRPPHTVVDLWQRAGEVRIYVQPGVTVRVVASLSAGGVDRVRWKNGEVRDRTAIPAGSRRDGVGRYDVTLGSGAPDLVVRITLLSGTVFVGENPDLASLDAPAPTTSPSASPTSSPTEGAQP